MGSYYKTTASFMLNAKKVGELSPGMVANFETAFDKAKKFKGKPTIIVANTIPGKGVSFMERKYQWHGKPPNSKEAKLMLKELRTLGGQIRSDHD